TLEEIFSGYGSQPYNLDQIELVSDGGAHEGSRFIRIAGDTWRGMTQFLAEVPVTPGRTYRISVAARLAPGMTAPSGAIGWPMYWFQQDGSAHNGNWPSIYYSHEVASKLTAEWQVFTSDVTALPGAAKLRPRLYGGSGSLASGEGIDFDSVRVVDVTELVLAEQAAADAQARADEAYAEAASKLDESQVDAKITASANGKNSITRSTSPASGDGVVEGVLWVQVDSAGDAFRQWYWDGSAWKPAQIKSDMLESLDVHKLQVTGTAKIKEAV